MTTILLCTMAIASLSLTSCKKEGCTNSSAINYDSEAKKDDGSCTYDQAAYDVSDLVEIGSTYAAGTQVKLYAEQKLFVGYNKLYCLLLDSSSNEHVDESHVSLKPMMDMGMHQHSSPVENPATTMANAKGLFEVPTYFVMSSMAGTWTMQVSVHSHASGKEGTNSMPIQVEQGNHKLSTSITDSNGSSPEHIFLALHHVNTPDVGSNDFELIAYKNMGMDTWTPVTDLQIEIEPHMPSMGHGSPNNVNPTHEKSGHYQGVVNYSMTGLWQIKLKIFRNGNLISDQVYFEYTL